MQTNASAGGLRLWGAVAILLVVYVSSSGIFDFAYGLGPGGWIAQLLGLAMAAPLL